MIALFAALALAKPPPAPATVDAPGAPAPAPDATEVTASLVVAVGQQEQSAARVVARARELGGWFQTQTPTVVSLRVPVDRADELVAFAESEGKVVDKQLSRTDLHAQLADLRGRLEARLAVLDEYYAVLKNATASSVVAVERQVVDAVAQIEALQGRIRWLEDRASLARIDVSFQFRERDAPARDGSSSFAWLNTLNLQDVVWNFQQDRPSYATKSVSVPEPPSGFSEWRKRRRYRAVSPDDVLFAVRSERHKPRAELSFWREGVRERMLAAGYKVLSESEIEASGTPGALLELAAPMGTEDWSYLVAFFPDGRRMLIAEAAGEIASVEAKKDALLTAIRALEP